MKRDDPNHEFVEQAKNRLDRSETELDPVTLGRIRAVRREALTAKNRPFWQMPVTAFASLALCVLLVNGLMPPNELPASVDLFEDVALLSAQEELEMYEELDLILWLLEEEAENGLG